MGEGLALNILGALLMGLFAGGFVATTGMLKDIRYEPFSLRKFVRSPIIALVWAIVGFLAFEVNDLFIMLGFCAGMERLTVEVWKGFLRRQMPSKFKSSDRDTTWLLKEAEKVEH